MIIKFRLNDKMHLMNNKAVKDKLRASDVRVANDLTRRQVTNITQAYEEGKYAYYKNGKLHVEDRRTQDPTPPAKFFFLHSRGSEEFQKVYPVRLVQS